MTPALASLMQNAFSGMQGGPRSLVAAISFYAQQDEMGPLAVEQELLKRLPSDPNDEIRKLIRRQLTQWDWEPSAPWTSGTSPNTPERRTRIYELLQTSQNLRAVLDESMPPYVGPGNVLIDNPSTHTDWYTYEFRKTRDFYWKRLTPFLEKVRQVPQESLASMDAATTEIIERLADPAAPLSYGARGLVVGYVQSGKTTNFTGVIAKAVDAGYRLIIVLSGTTNLLRNQTQRRLDMDIVGAENILRGTDESEIDHDYANDQDWPAKFISYGKRPSLFGSVDINRLTGQQDFQGHNQGINPLEFEFEKKNKQLPLYHRENLDHAGARIVVVKKNTDRLKQLVTDLRNAGAKKCLEIPALVIDDESDQASVNTINPNKIVDKTRSPINGYIVEILSRLPRAQYLGYTATPFANVFVNPADAVDIYPRDFILSLDRPFGYMGAREFHDFEAVPPGRLSNEKAYVRGIPEGPGSGNDNRLSESIDAFVLSGAIKKFRDGSKETRFRHHTMLIHQSAFKDDHRETVRVVRGLWKAAAYDSPGAAATRLQKLLEDFRSVWLDRGKRLGLAFPKNFLELKPALGAALAEIRRGDPVLMVNSAEGADVPNFDAKEGVWKIVVGGAKLSRGYTIEGLTISYFRRSTKLQDTLMQMGRWFGFRDGYQDLVRLYIGRSEPDGKHHTVDLYEEFKAMCRDEEDFRAQLEMYAKGSGITPREVPSLVFNSHPRLRPTAHNKRFNSEITWAAFNYREPTNQSVDNRGRKANVALFEQLFAKVDFKSETVKATSLRTKGFEAKWAKASKSDVLKVLKHVSWGELGCPINAEINYLQQSECPIDGWIVLAPQVGEKGEAGSWFFGKREFRCFGRTRLKTRFGVFSSPEHVKFAKWLVGDEDEKFRTSKLKQVKRTGVLLVYPTKEKSDGGKLIQGPPVMGFSLTLPVPGSSFRRVAYRVKIKSDPSAVVVVNKVRKAAA